MSFHYAESFYWLIPFAMLIALFSWSRWKRRLDLQKLGEWKIIQHLINLDALKRRIKKDLLSLIGVFFVIFAATGPQFGSRLKEVKQRGVDVFIAVDTSRSMLAEDVPPDRLSRAKQSLSYLIKKLEGNRLGIIAFAKFAVMQCPLTVDNDAARMFLDILDDKTVPEQGTALGDAIRLAVNTFNPEEKSGKAIVLLTDGEDHSSDPIGAAQLAKEKGIVIFTIGIGTSKGEVIKERDDQGKVVEFHKYQGQMVVSRMDDALLTKIATITGGHYYRVSSTDREIDEIADILNGYDKKEFSSKVYERREERYQIFLWIGFFLLLLEFFFAENPGQFGRWARLIKQLNFRSQLKKSAVLGLIMLLLPATLRADIREQVRRGNELLQKKDFVGARAQFESARIDAPEAAFLPYNIAGTYYAEGNFEEAKKNFEQALTMAKDTALKARASYNLGHVLFRMGEKAQAIERFKESLRFDPKDLDAKYNIEYIRAGKTPKNPPQQKKNKQDNSNQDKNDQKNKSDEKQDKGDQQQQDQKQDQTKKGDLSKEDSERVLKMMSEQEKEKMKDMKPVQIGKPRDKKKQDETGEDW